MGSCCVTQTNDFDFSLDITNSKQQTNKVVSKRDELHKSKKSTGVEETTLNNLSLINKQNLTSKLQNVKKSDIVQNKNDDQMVSNNNTSNLQTTTDLINYQTYQKKTSRLFDKSNFINMKNKNLFSEYQFCDRIGEGGYGYVYKTMHKKLKYYRAIKAIKKTSVDEDSFFNEINILKNVDHPNIIKLFETYFDSGFYYLVEEYCSGGDLYDFIKKQKDISERKVAMIMNQIFLAVNNLHSKNIVHRDLKPENIVFVDYETNNKHTIYSNSVFNNRQKNLENEICNSNIHIKLIDFGTSTYLKDDKLTQELGTIYYIAPEVFKNNYDEKCDIWSCGIILYTLLCGRPPFRGNKEIEIKNKILEFEKLKF